MGTNSETCPADIVDRWVDRGTIKGASLLVLKDGFRVVGHDAGLAKFTGQHEPVDDGTLFTIASITKPVTGACFMSYVEEDRFGLSDRVCEHIPELDRKGKREITFFHLLAHTSGLPEQVEGKDELRGREGGIAEFLERIYEGPLLFEPGEGAQYSNCGFALLARAVELAEEKRFGEVLRKRIFEPLGMTDSALGFDDSWDERIAEIELPRGREEQRAFVNSRYWRGMGAPWGAMISNTSDLGRFCEMFRRGGELNGRRILSESTVTEMTRKGLAWGVRGTGSGGLFGSLTSPRSYGHSGATGTFMWVDPEKGLVSVFLSNKEGGSDSTRFAELSDAIVRSCAEE
jgi:CubicO group peptidase (beta-lactamase class C family)